MRTFVRLLFCLLVVLFLYMTVNSAKAKDLIIHTDNDVFYYQNVERNNVIILPNDEVVDAEEIIDLEDNKEPFRSRDGVDIYRMEDNRYYMEDHSNDEE